MSATMAGVAAAVAARREWSRIESLFSSRPDFTELSTSDWVLPGLQSSGSTSTPSWVSMPSSVMRSGRSPLAASTVFADAKAARVLGPSEVHMWLRNPGVRKRPVPWAITSSM
jgi:hypothetical protein